MTSRGGIWLIYALGGGWGHLTRAASLARVARGRHRVRMLTNSPYVGQVTKAMPELDVVSIDPTLPTAAARVCAIQQIEAADPECLIVDTFPRGLGGELAGLLVASRAVKVLIHRDLSASYVADAGLHDFVRATYDLILIPGEGEGEAFGNLPSAIVTGPWLIREPSLDRSPTDRSRTGSGRVLVCAAGRAEELDWYGAAVARLLLRDPSIDVRCIAPSCPTGCPRDRWIEHWPAVDLYPTADVVIGGAGYNTVHECLAWRIPLVARPWPRLYDRQWLRARWAAERGLVAIVQDPEEAAEAAIRQRWQPSAEAGSIHNGVHEAVTLIEQVTCIIEP